MDEIQKFKEFLGPAANGYSRSQLRQLRREMYAMAELLLDIHLARHSVKKNGSHSRPGFDGSQTKA